MAITVLLADDNETIRKMIAQLLHADSDIELVGQASNVTQTIRLIKKLQPKVLVMDLHMGHRPVTSFNAKSDLPNGRLLAMSLSVGPEALVLADNIGAAILLDKSRPICGISSKDKALRKSFGQPQLDKW